MPNISKVKLPTGGVYDIKDKDARDALEDLVAVHLAGPYDSVENLPATGEKDLLYLVAADSGEPGTLFDEYIWVDLGSEGYYYPISVYSFDRYEGDIRWDATDIPTQTSDSWYIGMSFPPATLTDFIPEAGIPFTIHYTGWNTTLDIEIDETVTKNLQLYQDSSMEYYYIDLSDIFPNYPDPSTFTDPYQMPPRLIIVREDNEWMTLINGFWCLCGSEDEPYWPYDVETIEATANIEISSIYEKVGGKNNSDTGNYMVKGVDYVTAGLSSGEPQAHATIEGYNNYAGENSHAEGVETHASGFGSHAEGYQTGTDFESGVYAHAEGTSSQANGNSSHAEGIQTSASGEAAHAEGKGTQAKSSYSHAEGVNTLAGTNSSSGLAAHAEGSGTQATSSYSHAEGENTRATGGASHAEGSSSWASGDHSHAENHANASGINSHAEGTSGASGLASHSEGSGQSNGDYSHSEGNNTKAYANYSHAEGLSTTTGMLNQKTSAVATHAEGYNTQAIQNYAHAEGLSAIASGEASHAEGHTTTAFGRYSHAQGIGTNASKQCQFTFGSYNILDHVGTSSTRGKYIEIVGNGQTDDSRSNARALDWDGNEELAGKLTVGVGPTNNMDVATKQYVDTAISTAITNAINGGY